MIRRRKKKKLYSYSKGENSSFHKYLKKKNKYRFVIKCGKSWWKSLWKFHAKIHRIIKFSRLVTYTSYNHDIEKKKKHFEQTMRVGIRELIVIYPYPLQTHIHSRYVYISGSHFIKYSLARHIDYTHMDSCSLINANLHAEPSQL